MYRYSAGGKCKIKRWFSVFSYRFSVEKNARPRYEIIQSTSQPVEEKQRKKMRDENSIEYIVLSIELGKEKIQRKTQGANTVMSDE